MGVQCGVGTGGLGTLGGMGDLRGADIPVGVGAQCGGGVGTQGGGGGCSQTCVGWNGRSNMGSTTRPTPPQSWCSPSHLQVPPSCSWGPPVWSAGSPGNATCQNCLCVGQLLPVFG